MCLQMSSNKHLHCASLHIHQGTPSKGKGIQVAVFHVCTSSTQPDIIYLTKYASTTKHRLHARAHTHIPAHSHAHAHTPFHPLTHPQTPTPTLTLTPTDPPPPPPHTNPYKHSPRCGRDTAFCKCPREA